MNEQYQYNRGGFIHHTANAPWNTQWGNPAPISRETVQSFVDEVNKLYNPGHRGEQAARNLKIQPGDRIRLTEISQGHLPLKDAATLEGIVQTVKTTDKQLRVQIKGFGVQGNNIFWPLRNYKVEVLHRAYRWTDEDRAIVAMVSLSESCWEAMLESNREEIRKTWRPRLVKVRKALGLDNNGVE